MKKIFLAAFLHLTAFSLYAYDFGLVFNQNADLNAPISDTEKTGFKISGALLPRFSALFGENGDLYVSAAVNYQTAFGSGASGRGEPFAVMPELTRTDFAFYFRRADIRIGRMFFSDPLELVANSLFDGARVSFITRNGNFHAGAWYAGLLYKERAAIAMTPDEMKSGNSEVDYNDFGNTYFAPSRVLAALEYDHPSLAGFVSLKTSIIGQFDAGDEKLNSQYFTAALSVPVKSLIFDLGGCFELIQYNDEIKPAFAADAGLTLILPAKLEKHITLSWRYSSGVSEDETTGAFLPVTTVKQGEILEAKLSALSLLSLGFTGRLAESLSANFAFTYFIRNDLGTYRAYPVAGVNSEGFFLGAEIYGRVIWNITTGARLNFGTGLFIPELGDAAPDAGMMWRTNVNLVISIY